MASTDGVSVQGFQAVINFAGLDATSIQFKIDGDSATPPRDVGYFYVMFLPSGNEPAMIWSHGICYKTGAYIDLPKDAVVGQDAVLMWVNWKQEGLNWSTVF